MTRKPFGTRDFGGGAWDKSKDPTTKKEIKLFGKDIRYSDNLNWKPVLSVWWWLYWRLFSVLLVIIFIVSFLEGMLQNIYDTKFLFTSQISGTLFLLTSIFFVKKLLINGKFKGFSVVLLKTIK